MWLNFDLKLDLLHSALKFIRNNFFSKNKSSSYHYTMVSLLIFIKSFWSLRSYLFKSLTNKNFRDHSEYDLRYRKKIRSDWHVEGGDWKEKPSPARFRSTQGVSVLPDGRIELQRHLAFYRDKRLETKQAIMWPPPLRVPKRTVTPIKGLRTEPDGRCDFLLEHCIHSW